MYAISLHMMFTLFVQIKRVPPWACYHVDTNDIVGVHHMETGQGVLFYQHSTEPDPAAGLEDLATCNGFSSWNYLQTTTDEDLPIDHVVSLSPRSSGCKTAALHVFTDSSTGFKNKYMGNTNTKK